MFSFDFLLGFRLSALTCPRRSSALIKIDEKDKKKLWLKNDNICWKSQVCKPPSAGQSYFDKITGNCSSVWRCDWFCNQGTWHMILTMFPVICVLSCGWMFLLTIFYQSLLVMRWQKLACHVQQTPAVSGIIILLQPVRGIARFCWLIPLCRKTLFVKHRKMAHIS